MFRFSWWRDENNRDGATALVSVLQVVVPAVVILGGAVWGYLYATEEPKASAAPEISVSTGDGSPVSIGDGNTQSVTSN